MDTFLYALIVYDFFIFLIYFGFNIKIIKIIFIKIY